jgi:hypothetical protein
MNEFSRTSQFEGLRNQIICEARRSASRRRTIYHLPAEILHSAKAEHGQPGSMTDLFDRAAVAGEIVW